MYVKGNTYMLQIDYCNYKIFLLKHFLLLCKYCVSTFKSLVNDRGYALPITSSHHDIS